MKNLIILLAALFSVNSFASDSSLCFIGEVRMFAGPFTPGGWLPAQGQTLNIADHPVLYQVLSTTYGSDPSAPNTTFKLPDLTDRALIGTGGTKVQLGDTYGPDATHKQNASGRFFSMNFFVCEQARVSDRAVILNCHFLSPL